MRLVVNSYVWALLFLGCNEAIKPGEAFVVPKKQINSALERANKQTTTELNDIPSKVNIDIEIPLPNWAVDAGNSILNNVEKLGQVSAAATSNVIDMNNNQQPFSWSKEFLASLLSTTTLPLNPSKLEVLQSALLTQWHLEAVLLFGLGSSLLWFVTTPETFDEAPYEPGTTTYNPEKAAEFYNQRPLMVLKRILKLAFLTGSFNTGLLFDWLVLGKLFRDEEYTALKKNEPRRAKVALRLCEQLGPTFIKLGQALSIRTDLIPEAYALELRQLQDAVPPFDSDLAREVLKEELGVSDLNTIFSSLSNVPVASASIGQVYRGTLATTGQDVAVKVQRPGILAEIALDLHVLRVLTPIQTILQNAANGVKTTQEDIDTAVALVDEWGRGFVAETDYRLEAKNTETFEAAMRQRGLDTVCAPPVVNELVRDKIMVTEWIEGTRLDRDASPDVPRLCGVAINAYLTMLLDTGVLHCDPHPGNLLRTKDGKLCILDWGMTLEVPNNLQYALLELIAHINIQDYDSIPQDFINLGFSPEGVTAERLKSSGITEGLTFAFRQLSQGGGPKKIQERVKAEFQERYGGDLTDKELQQAARAEMLQRMEEQLASEGVDVKGVTNVMEEMSKRNRELFTLPPYVLYVARAFSTLEGIGLSVNDNYAIIQECYPYLARRLFTDRSPRAKKALRAMLGLSEEEYSEMDQSTSSSSALAIVQAGARGEDYSAASALSNNGKKGQGVLSFEKLIEMSDGFASYTAATSSVDMGDGNGGGVAANGQAAAAAAELAKLLLDPQGSTLQDILVEEAARLGDAATRSTLKSSLVDSAAGKAAFSLLKTQKDIIEQSGLSNFLPKPIKTALVDRPAELPELVEALLSTTSEDEKLLNSAKGLQTILSSRLGNNSNSGDAKSSRSRISTPDTQLLDINTLRTLLADEQTRQLILEQAPGILTLGRRLSAGLLRRAAYRTNQTGDLLPEETRKALVDLNHRLAKVVDGPTTTIAENDNNKASTAAATTTTTSALRK